MKGAELPIDFDFQFGEKLQPGILRLFKNALRTSISFEFKKLAEKTLLEESAGKVALRVYLLNG